MMNPSEHPAPRRSAALRWTLAVCALLAFAGFLALGTWQVQRLAWKRDLIARVEQRVNAAAVEAPDVSAWGDLSADADAYRKVRVSGTYLNEQSARVQAVTDLGPGFWLLTPLRRDDGSIVFVNRGYIAGKTGVPGPAGKVSVSGLLRLTEPGGAFLHENDPARDRWYSRDIAALASARGLSNVAPYFIDAARGQEGASASRPASGAAPATAPGTASGPASEVPVGGLTVIHFANSHLVYALTWYGLALMVAAAAVWVVRDERRLRRSGYN